MENSESPAVQRNAERTAEDRKAKNIAIAEWLGYRLNRGTWHKPQCRQGVTDTIVPDGCHPYLLPDFFTSEEASALVLEKLAGELAQQDIHLEHLRHVGWSVLSCSKKFADADDWAHIFTHADRKTAIAEAALALIEEVNGAK